MHEIEKWYCTNCQHGVNAPPPSAARSTPEKCPNCKTWSGGWASQPGLAFTSGTYGNAGTYAR